MKIRPFEWRDIPALHRYRRRGLFLDSRQLLTRGPVLVPAGAVLTSLASRTGIFTYLCEPGVQKGEPLIGQVTHNGGATFARLAFLAPETGVDAAGLPALFDQMAAEIGERGAFHLLAEVDDQSPAFRALHQAGFAIYARQRIWRLDGAPPEPGGLAPWRACSAGDLVAVRTLYNNLVPGLVQQVEPLPREHLKGMVYYHPDGMHAYVELRYGSAGIWAQPFIHPDVEDLPARLVRLLQMLPGRQARPVYLCVRSYQSWLEPAIEALGAVPGPAQAVMVRHLALPRRAAEPYAMPAMNGTRTEPVARITNKMIDDREVKLLGHDGKSL